MLVFVRRFVSVKRIIKQKYSFLLIEDCLSRLSDKKVFTVLDLKDGFYQINVHPDHTKYFFFVIPDGHSNLKNSLLVIARPRLKFKKG